MASPTTPDSDRTICPSDNAIQPLRKTRLYELSAPPKGDAEFCDRAAGANMQILADSAMSQVPSPHVKDDREASTVLHHHQRQPSEFPVPRSTFLPPESPNALSPTNHFKSLGADLNEMKPTVPVDDYAGIKLGSSYLLGPELASTYQRQINPADSYDGHNDSPESKSTFTGQSVNTSLASTPSKMQYNNSDTTSLMSDFGHFQESPGHTHRFHIPFQSKTFPQLANERGVRPWDSHSIDDRWSLGSGEAGPKSTYEPLGNMWSTPTPWNTGVSSDQSSSPSKSTNQHPRGGSELHQANNEPPSQSPAVARGPSHVPNPAEVARLTSLVNDIAHNPPNMASGYSADLIKSYFYDRVFGYRDGPEPMDEDEASKLTVHNGQTKTFADVRRYVLDIIDELSMVCLKQVKREHEHEARVQLAAHGLPTQAPRIDQVFRPQLQNLHQGFQPQEEVSHSGEGPNLGQELYDEVSQDTNKPWLARLQTNIPPPARRNTNPQILSAESSSDTLGSMTASMGSLGFSPENQALRNPWDPVSTPQTATSTYWNPAYANLMAASQAHANSRDGLQALTNHNLGHLQNQTSFLQQQAGFQTPASMYGQTYQTAGGIHGPNGIFIPNDRYVRPPASNRMAPLFAHSGAWQANRQLPSQVHAATGRSTPTLTAPNSGRQTRQPSPSVQTDNRRLAYLEGSDEMYPQPVFSNGASVRLQNLVRNPVPDYNVITHESNIPFVETARASKPAEWGVLRLGNIPYDLSKTQVSNFLGTHAKIITPDIGPAIHIVMDRATGKTQDCFVEFFSVEDARVWEKNIRGRSNHYNRIGDRLIEVCLSNQDDLLKELFPRAKSVIWQGGYPIIQEPEEPYNTGFKTFISAEELGIHLRHAEQPQRSNYTMKCQNRPYEAMISLLAKFPWQDTTHYTMAIRNKIFEAVQKMLAVLCREIRRNHSADKIQQPNPYPSGMIGTGLPYPVNYTLPRQPPPPPPPTFSRNQTKSLTPALLTELLRTALNAPGFSELQRWELYHCVGADLNIRQNFNISPLGQHWPFEALGRKRAMEEDVVAWYARIMGQHFDNLDGGESSTVGNPFGDMRRLFGQIGEDATMDQAGMLEWDVMAKMITGYVRKAHLEAVDEGEQLAILQG